MTNMTLIEGFWFPTNIDPEWFRSIKREIEIGNEYFRYGLDINEGDIVVDCGANVGIFTKLANKKGAKQIYSIEIFRDYYNCLIQNTKQYKNIKTINGLLTDIVNYPKLDWNMERIFNDLNLEYIDFMKIDIEGYEYPFLLKADDEYFNKVKKYAVEVHVLFTDWMNLYNLMEKFSKNGFKLSFERIHKETNLGMLYAQKF